MVDCACPCNDGDRTEQIPGCDNGTGCYFTPRK